MLGCLKCKVHNTFLIQLTFQFQHKYVRAIIDYFLFLFFCLAKVKSEWQLSRKKDFAMKVLCKLFSKHFLTLMR